MERWISHLCKNLHLEDPILTSISPSAFYRGKFVIAESIDIEIEQNCPPRLVQQRNEKKAAGR